jgi:hypothetical protein
MALNLWAFDLSSNVSVGRFYGIVKFGNFFQISNTILKKDFGDYMRFLFFIDSSAFACYLIFYLSK